MTAMSSEPIPTHVGYIVDGNRRWAKAHSLPTYEGHLAGYNTVKEIVRETIECGVKFVTLYSFSTENWQRAEAEVSGIMKLAMRLFTVDVKELVEQDVRLLVLGERADLSSAIQRAIEKAEAKTAGGTRGTIAICFNYGGQQEIAQAVQRLVAEGGPTAAITPEAISRHLYHPEVPPVDLIVRSSGEQRLSNFMLWRSSYSELLFLEKLWPDMTKGDVAAILKEYARRKRRFGG